MAKRLTDRTIKALKPASPGKRVFLHDADVPGFGVRITDKGVRTFVLQARFPGAKWASPRALGTYPETTLEKAREKARAWRQLIREGVDPGIEQMVRRQANERRQADTFAAVAAAWLTHIKRLQQSKAEEIERDIEREFLPLWGERPVTSITHRDVTEAIEAVIKRGTERRPKIAQAHNLLGELRRLFSWAVNRGTYDLERSPCERIKPSELIGERTLRERVLTDDELRAFWRATAKLGAHGGYPYGPLLRLLLLTIQRKSEVAEASWSEFGHTVRDAAGVMQNELFEIPGERMKSGRAHTVPLPAKAIEILGTLPTFTRGPFVFSTTHGEKPVNGFAKAKEKLDGLMLAELRAIAEERGDDPDKVNLESWVIHDLRRTGRTALAMLPVPDAVAELVIAHAKRGLHRVYDQHKYIAEKRQALELWAARLRDIVEPAPANVVSIETARGQ